jgi:hypothetical protein
VYIPDLLSSICSTTAHKTFDFFIGTSGSFVCFDEEKASFPGKVPVGRV